MRTLVLVLAEAGLELIPETLWSHPSVRSSAARRGKRPGELLLDVSLHYHAMLRLREREKRGRPDIAHTCLLVAMSSLLNKAGLLEVYVHTYRGVWIGVRRDTRIPRNYNRFVGLIEQLLLEGRVPPDSENPLMWTWSGGFKEGLARLECNRVYLLSEKGTPMTPRDLAKELARHERPAVIIGAFQRGRFSRQVVNAADEVVSLAPVTLDAWAVVARVLASVEDELRLYERVLRGEVALL